MFEFFQFVNWSEMKERRAARGPRPGGVTHGVQRRVRRARAAGWPTEKCAGGAEQTRGYLPYIPRSNFITFLQCHRILIF